MKLDFRKSFVAYDSHGSGHPVVLLHGFLEDLRMWNDIVSELSDSHKVIVVDLPGHGQSPSISYEHRMEDHAESVHAVLHFENVLRPVIIGHSMGGYVALAYAEKYGEDLSGLGLFHSTSFADSEKKKLDRQRAIDSVIKHPGLFSEMSIPNLFNPARKVELAGSIIQSVEMAKSQPKQGIVANLRGMISRPDRLEIFRNFDGPKLFVQGMVDPVLDPNIGEQQCRNVENLTSEFLDDVGHMGHIEAPASTVKIINEFALKCANG